MNCVIVDDEPRAVEILEAYVRKTPFLEWSASFRNPMKALVHLEDNATDLLLLDIDMPDLSGLQLLRSLTVQPLVIFVTAHGEYAVDSYEFDAVDYLLKPVEYDRFLKAATRARGRLQGRRDHLFLKSGTKLIRVALGEIRFVQAAGNYVTFVAGSREIMTLMTMKDTLERLPDAGFVRVHKSYIVSLDRVDEVEADRLVVDGRTVPIGDVYRDEFLRALGRIRRSD